MPPNRRPDALPRCPRHAFTWLALLVAVAAWGPLAPAQDLLHQRYEPTDAVLTNPERGLYVQYTARGHDADPLDAAALAALREQHITMVLRLYYLNEFRDAPIDAARLQLIAGDMDALREAGVKCILRFAYNEKIGDPDAPIDVVLGHMEQLKPVLADNADVIAVAQAGFVGSWGEWHASTNDLREPENARRIIAGWLDILPASRVVQVRTPLIKWMLVETDEPLDEDAVFVADGSRDPFRGRIGHHNDCFLASETDMGTYQDIPAEMAYLEQETRFLPMGGETCAIHERNDPATARDELSRFHWSYLHLDYHPGVIESWRESGFLDEVERKLGYRLVLKEARVTAETSPGGTLEVQIKIDNTGWAAPFNPRAVEVVLREADGDATYHAALDTDPRRWLPGEPIKLTATLALPDDLPAGTYDVLLSLPDPEPRLRDRPEFAIQLGNDGLWEPLTGLHDLGLLVEVGTDAAMDDPKRKTDGAFVPRASRP